MSDSEDAFAELAINYGFNNELHAAILEAEQWYDKNRREGYSNVDVMRRAWDSLDPVRQVENMENLFNGFWHHRRDNLEAEAMSALARADGESFLEHDDLEVIEYSLSTIEGEPFQELDEFGSIGVPLDVLARLVNEVKYLRARLDLAKELAA